METQKSLFRRVIELALLAGLVVGLVWIISIQTGMQPMETNEPSSVLLVESPYPPPPTPTQAPTATALPYPAPENLLVFPTVSTPNLCTTSDWLTFTNSDVGFSIQYPDETSIYVAPDLDTTKNHVSIVTFFLLPRCYDATCSKASEIRVILLQNPDLLPVQEFVEQTYELFTSPPYLNSLENYEETGYFFRIEGERAFRVEAGILLGLEPEIFIPHGNKVIWIYHDGGGIGGGPVSPCAKTIDLLNEMLETVVLFSPSE